MQAHPPEFFLNGAHFGAPKETYFPSEDSYFLAENVSIPKKALMIDVGCGSGIQSLNAFHKGASRVIALDLNKAALAATKKNCLKAGFKNIKTIESDLFRNCREKADAIIFNPPYLESDEYRHIDLDGGKKGREVLDRFLEQMPKHLNKKGVCYFLQTDLNGNGKTGKKLKELGFEFKIIARKKGFFETLCIYRCSKKADLKVFGALSSV